MNKRNILFIIISALALTVSAHNAKIATFTLQDSGMGWYVNMSFPRSAIDIKMLEMHGEERLKKVTKEQYQHLFIEYLELNFHLKVDDILVELKSGGIRLGGHQVDLKYLLPEISNPKEIEAHIPLFKESHNQTNIFRVYRGGKQLSRFFLSENNDFYVNLLVEDGIISNKSKEELKLNFAGFAGFSVFALLLISIAMILKKKLENPEFCKTE